MLKRIVAMVLALSFIGVMGIASDAFAKRGGRPKPVPGCEDIVPGCHPED